ncbi:hypothetical protein IEQ34_021759 [Dendrobium chrysotoxum]|uniref:Uncharacterized protein n=1 Tax=Dendrobium chrysotoxum TaxID=161865 RepID=A0AAV7G6F6_DENCH|nr:hypothetical protein IEQ34_021759 [Dendrobium chrysotoxum]
MPPGRKPDLFAGNSRNTAGTGSRSRRFQCRPRGTPASAAARYRAERSTRHCPDSFQKPQGRKLRRRHLRLFQACRLLSVASGQTSLFRERRGKS